MIHRSLFAVLVLSLVTVPSLSFGQATNAPTAPAVTPPAPAPAATAPAPAPAATETVTTPAGSDVGGARPDTYTIAQGDTLWSISHKFNTSIKALQKLNGLKKHALLHIGQVIKIPPATADSK